MLTKFNAKQLATIYGMSESSLHSILQPHRDKLKELATKYFDQRKQKVVVRRDYNSQQLQYIISEIIKDMPLGYNFDGNTLIQTFDYK